MKVSESKNVRCNGKNIILNERKVKDIDSKAAINTLKNINKNKILRVNGGVIFQERLLADSAAPWRPGF